MSLISRVNGWSNGIIRFMLMDNTSTSGGGLVGLAITEPTLIIAVTADLEPTATVYKESAGTIATIATLGTYAAPTTGQCRFKEFDSTNHPGKYELQLINTRFSVSNASYLIVTVQATGFKCSAQSFLIDLQSQVDVRNIGGVAASASSGLLNANVVQIGGSVGRVTALGLELDGRNAGTVGGTFTPTSTAFECTDLTSSASFPLYENSGFIVTSGAQTDARGVILSDQVGTSGRRFTCAALPGGALASGDTILIL